MRKKQISLIVTLLCGLAPCLLGNAAVQTEERLDRARAALKISSDHVAVLEAERKTGKIRPGAYARSLRFEIIPMIAASEAELFSEFERNPLSGAWLKRTIDALKAQRTGLESIALVFDAKDRLARSEEHLRKGDFELATMKLDDYWVASRSALELRIKEASGGATPETATALRKDLSQMSETAYRLEILAAQKYLAIVKGATFSARVPAQFGPDWSGLERSTEKQLQRLEFVSRVYPEGNSAPLRERLSKMQEALTGA